MDRNDDRKLYFGAMTTSRHSRRRFLRHSVLGGLAIAGFSTLIAACADADDITDDTEAPVDEPDTDDVDTDDTTDEPDDDTPTDDAPTGGRAVVTVDASPTVWDLSQSDWNTWRAVNYLYDRLLHFDENEEITPHLVVDWQISDDALSYTLELRDDVQFHDGTHFDAHSVDVNTRRHSEHPESAFYDGFSAVENIEVVDDYTVRIDLSEVRANFIYDLTGWGTIQLSPQAMEELGDDFGQSPVGSGPFQFVEYEPDSHIDYARFDDYWQGPTPLDSLRVRIIPEKSVQIIELEAGTADSVYAVEPQDLQRVEDAGMELVTDITPGTQFISLNVSKGPTAELAVRQAIARAINRELIMEQVLHGLPEKARAGAPSFSPYYHDEVPMVEYDPDEAVAILEEAGWEEGATGVRERDGEQLFVNILSTDFADWALFNEIYQEQLSEVGIESEIETLEWGAYLDNWRENLGEWHLTHHSQGALIASLGIMLASWGPDQFWNINQIRDSDDPELMEVADELQEIYDELLREVDMDVRQELALQGQTLYQDHQLTVWLWHSPHSLAVNPRLRDYSLSYHGRVLDLYNAWIDE